ncbi:hypothetical protein C8J57DRAFT_1713782 [Mycena rebaudengoi]|nr:hypothetical protein C8J57DRAFT_1713782 [Mycena rebaudengoi]
MFAFATLYALSAAAAVVSAGPLRPRTCDTSALTMDLPAGQTKLVNPTTAPAFVLLGVGTQNYTCGAAGTYASAGAVASLFDISCLDSSSGVEVTAFSAWSNADASVPSASIGAQVNAPEQLGDHFFITSPSGTGISPRWQLASSFVLAAKRDNIPAPNDPATNVDWLVLDKVDGTAATQVFRVNTAGGQPPKSCTVGSDPITVKYTSKYFLY